MYVTKIESDSFQDGSYFAGLHSYLPSWRTAILVPLAYGATLFLSVYLGHLAQLGISPIFPAPAIAIVALLRNRRPTWPALLSLCAVADLAASFHHPDRVLVTLNCFVNLLGALLIATLLGRFADLRTWFMSGRWFALLVCFSLVSVVTANLVGALIVFAIGHPFLAKMSLLLLYKTMVTDSISIVLTTPLILSWTETALRHNLRSWQLMQAIALIAAVAAAASLVFLFSDSVAPLFLVLPLLVLLTLRTGLPGATAGAVTIMAIGTFLTARGIGPIATYPELGVGGRILFLQLYFLSAILSSIPIAVILMIRATLADEVKQQGAISNAALSNMAQGLSMFDQYDRLTTCNRRFAELYDLPDHLIQPLSPLQDILDHHGQGDAAASRKFKSFIRELVATGDPTRSNSDIKLPDGRIISIFCRPLEEGGWVATHEDVTERRLAEERISFLANHDPLTGLANRTHFNRELERVLALTQDGQIFALHALDLDRFKAVNDTLGHSAGDELLKLVSERLRRAVRSGDVIARLGGDEFAILQYPLKAAGEAGALAGRIIELLNQPFEISHQKVGIGMSIGIALAPADAALAAELMQKADLALYRAKADGRDTFRFYEPAMDAAQQARLVLDAELRLAVSRDEFEVYYQPIVNTSAGTIDSFEALARWRHPKRGIVEPAEFIGIAEETGLIMSIGESVLNAACRQAASWPAPMKVAVNVSALQFKSRGLVAVVRKALIQARLDPARLELEITESVLMHNNKFVLKTLHQLRKMGISIAMDDFGTGYSSLSSLRSFPFDKIKIDRSFISDLTTRSDSLAIVHAAIELAGRLGMTSTAEGVETAEEYAFLEGEGCTNIQGYYISRPVPAHQVPALLAQYRGPHDELMRLVS